MLSFTFTHNFSLFKQRFFYRAITKSNCIFFLYRNNYYSDLNNNIQRYYFSDIKSIRNIGIFAHIDAGKTSTAECLLYNAREITFRGSIDDGTTHMDFLPQERQHGITIQSAVTTLYWENHQINVIDTPGHIDFTEEVRNGLPALDGAIVVLDGVNGVEAQTETIWRYINNTFSLNKLIFINKLDRDGSSLEFCTEMIKNRLLCTPLIIHLPFKHSKMKGIFHLVDLIDLKEYIFSLHNEHFIKSHEQINIPNDILIETRKQANLQRLKLLEDIADLDDIFAELFLLNKEFTSQDIWSALQRITLSNKAVIVLCGSAINNIGIKQLMNSVINLLPSPINRNKIKTENTNIKINDLYKRACYNNKRNINNFQTKGAISCITDNKEIIIDENVTPSCLCFKVISDHKGGRLIFCRVLSGKIKPQMKFFNSKIGIVEQISGIFRIKADHYSKLNSISAGDIAMFRGFNNTIAGDTLICCDNNCYSNEIPFILYSHIKQQSPICFCQFIAQSPNEEEKLLISLKEMAISDASLHIKRDEEFGQILVWGLGELHLSIVKERLLDEYNLDVEIGEMEIAYREYLEEPLEGSLNHKMEISGKHYSMNMSLSLHPQLLPSLDDDINLDKTSFDQNSYDCHVEYSDEFYEITKPNMQDPTFKPLTIEKLNEIITTISTTLYEAFRNGPTIGSPLISLIAKVNNISIDPNTPTGVVQSCTTHLFRNLTQKLSTSIMEPIMLLTIYCEEGSIGILINDLSKKRRARIREITSARGSEYGQNLMKIISFIPLKSMLGYAGVLRSLTHGTASFNMEVFGYELAHGNVIKEILEKKGF